jgi:hypothetical protein
MLGILIRVIRSRKHALDKRMLEIRRMVAKSALLMNPGPDLCPTNPTFWEIGKRAGSHLSQ